jgi:hypothetical protein
MIPTLSIREAKDIVVGQVATLSYPTALPNKTYQNPNLETLIEKTGSRVVSFDIDERTVPDDTKNLINFVWLAKDCKLEDHYNPGQICIVTFHVEHRPTIGKILTKLDPAGLHDDYEKRIYAVGYTCRCLLDKGFVADLLMALALEHLQNTVTVEIYSMAEGKIPPTLMID